MAKRILSFLVCFFTFSTISMFSAGYEGEDERFYISSSQLICSNDGIFVILEHPDGNLSKNLVPQVNWDENGLFVSALHLPFIEAGWCRNGHRTCNKCYKCSVQGCPSYGCRCKR